MKRMLKILVTLLCICFIAASLYSTQIGKVTTVRVVSGKTQFKIDSCAGSYYFEVASTNVDRIDITRMVIASMIFKKDVNLYDTSGGYMTACPSTANLTIGTVRLQ